MAKYYNQQGLTKKQKRLKRFRFLSIVALFAVFVFIGMLGYDAYKQWNKSETPTTSTTPVTSTIVSNTEVQTTPYFQMNTPSKWKAVANETKDGHYVYRQFNSTLVEQELVVDVNNLQPDILANTQVTRVLPVRVSDEGFIRIAPGAMEHCKKAVKPETNRTQQVVTMDKVTFPCTPTGTNFVVVVGKVGGNTLMDMPRPSGGRATYKITYRSLSATPSTRDFTNIIETFETR